MRQKHSSENARRRRKRAPHVSGVILLAAFLLLARGGSDVTGGEEASGGDSGPDVLLVTVDGAINPVTAGFIEKGIEQAVGSGADLLVIQLDTPGGLMTSTRQIVKDLLSPPVPVAVYVSPPGARAASAGVFITMAANVAAMAPGTNIGAAHPVSIGGGFPPGKKPEEEKKETAKEKGQKGDEAEKRAGEERTEGRKGGGDDSARPAQSDGDVMAEKVLNDTVAFIRSIAEQRGRNADWAEKAVRQSVSVNAREALELGVVDLLADNLDDLLAAMDGRTVKVDGEDRLLSLKGALVRELPMDWRRRLLAVLSDPNVAYILMMLGIYGIFFELANPGVILPGVLGGIFLILAFFSFQVLPVNYAGLLLILLALVLFLLEIKVVSYGMLTVGAVISLFLGSIMLFDSAEPYYRLSIYLVAGMTAGTALFFAVGVGLAVRIQRRRPTTGVEGLVGESGVVSSVLAPEGKVKVHGEIWKAVAESRLEPGTKVRVTAVRGMTLEVEAEQSPAAGVASPSEDQTRLPGGH